jgi:hypothetical protein
MNIRKEAQKAVKTHSAKITALQFYDMIAKDPSIFKDWETPLEITGHVQCYQDPITHLSKHLTFSHKGGANFACCKNLETATGTFHGYAYFLGSGVKKIENLTVTGADKIGRSANFAGCESLKIATGNYYGNVSFNKSGVHTIQNLHIQNPNEDGNYADFYECPNLQTLKGWDLSKKIIIESEKLEEEKSRRALLKFHKENKPQELPFL